MKQYPVLYQQLSNGETIAYRKAGSKGQTLLLLHGNMSSSVFWQTTMEKLESEISIVAPDLRGFGDSTYKQSFDSLLELATDLKEFVEKLDLEKFIVLGWSTGGGVALELATLLPNRVEKVILLDSVGVNGFTIYKKDEMGQMMFDQIITTKAEIANDPVQVLPILNAYETKNKEMLKMIWNATIYIKAQPNEELYDAYLDAMLKQRNLVDIDYSLVHFNMEENGEKISRFKEIKVPIVIMHGDEDLIVPYKEAKKMKEYFKDQAELITLKGVGHSVMTDNFELWLEQLRKAIF